MRTADFDYELPPELIAQVPAPQRDQSRLLVLHRQSGQVEHRRFHDLPGYLRSGDLLVLNNSRVIPARLRGMNALTGGKFELLLLAENAINDWWVMLRPGKRARVGTQIVLLDARGQPCAVRATVLDTNIEGHRRLRFTGSPNLADLLDDLGEVPLPPYIARPDAGRTMQDRQRYQTVFARPAGSVAAPTAGLHFTESLLAEIAARGVQVCFLTLHVGLGTFAPVKAETIAAHTMHEERYELGEETARAINEAKSSGRRVIAVGTTTARVLESLANPTQPQPRTSNSGGPTSDFPSSVSLLRRVDGLRTSDFPWHVPGAGKTRIFIFPPYDFRIADAMLTNFHLPRSTLLMLVSAFAAPRGTQGRELILSAYAAAIRERYRFFSYGDAMLIL